MNAPFLILETGQPVAAMRRHGGFPHWIRVAAGLGADDAVAIDVERGQALPARFPVQATHLQSVLALPAGAVRLATSALDDVHAFRWGDSAWGVQFHPEFSTTHMHGYLRARREALAREGRDARALAASVKATPQARQVLRRFVRVARKRAPMV